MISKEWIEFCKKFCQDYGARWVSSGVADIEFEIDGILIKWSKRQLVSFLKEN